MYKEKNGKKWENLILSFKKQSLKTYLLQAKWENNVHRSQKLIQNYYGPVFENKT